MTDWFIEGSRKVVHWIDMFPVNTYFNVYSIYHALNCEVPQDVIEVVLTKKYQRDDLDMSHDQKLYFKKAKKKEHDSIDKRVADLETKYKWLENVVAEVNLHVDKLLEPSQKDKKHKPLWHPWTNSKEMTAPNGQVDVMLASGEIITEFSGRELNWLDNLDSEKKIVAWRWVS